MCVDSSLFRAKMTGSCLFEVVVLIRVIFSTASRENCDKVEFLTEEEVLSCSNVALLKESMFFTLRDCFRPL